LQIASIKIASNLVNKYNRSRTYLFVKVPQPGDSEGTFEILESRCHLLLGYQSNHSKVEAIPLSALPKDTTMPIFTLSLFNVESQAGKLQILTF